MPPLLTEHLEATAVILEPGAQVTAHISQRNFRMFPDSGACQSVWGMFWVLATVTAHSVTLGSRGYCPGQSPFPPRFLLAPILLCRGLAG